MKIEAHITDEQLRLLLYGDERSAATVFAESHVECCSHCQQRLDRLAGDDAVVTETRNMLSDYPWDQLETSRELLRPQVTLTGSIDLDFLSAPSHPEMLGRLGRYEIERVIGSGGMGIVFKAFDTELNRPVAVKVLASHLAHKGAARRRFARESRAAAAVVHEHVVAIHNVEADGDVPFLVMQFVSGESLQARVEREGPLDVLQMLRIGIQVASGLAAAHEQGVIHRDIKPANIMLEHGIERVLITDFGLARTVDEASLTQTGAIAGTPHYMSPEQANGQPTDHRTDLFSLGSVLYFMATGHPPFRAERAMGVLNRICNDRAKPLWQVADDVPDELSVLVERLLEKQPAKRAASAEEVYKRLANTLAKAQQPKSGALHQLRRCAYRYPQQIIASAIFTAISLLALFATVIWLSSPAQRDDREVGRATDVSSDSVAQNVPTAFTASESEAFEATISGLNQRLDALNQHGEVPLPVREKSSEPETPQSLHQRLERLQEQYIPPSRHSRRNTINEQ